MARRRRAAPSAVEPDADVPVPTWAQRAIERGRFTLEEYRERVRERRRERIADMIERVPPAVEAEGPEAVETWAEEMVDHRDPRLFLKDEPGPRDPLPAQAASRREASRRR